MKKIIYLVFCLLLSHKGMAQTITSASTAQECVKVINDAVKLGDGKHPVHPFNRTSSFRGGEFVTYSAYSSTIFADVYQNIYWTKFDTITTSKTENNRIFVMLNFKPNSIIREELRIDVGRQLIDERKSAEESYIGFYIPGSEEGRIKDIELAAKRLKDIATLQTDVFYTDKTQSKIQSIEGKPSFYETVNYINTYLRDIQSNDFFCNGDSYINKFAVVGEKLKISSYSNFENVLQDINSYTQVELYSAYQRSLSVLYNTPPTQRTYSINLSNVEEIKIVTDTGFPGGCRQFGLWFVEKGKSATPVMHLPLWKDINEKNFAEFKNTQIYKAFDHLRKLSGAPEPISF